MQYFAATDTYPEFLNFKDTDNEEIPTCYLRFNI